MAYQRIYSSIYNVSNNILHYTNNIIKVKQMGYIRLLNIHIPVPWVTKHSSQKRLTSFIQPNGKKSKLSYSASVASPLERAPSHQPPTLATGVLGEESKCVQLSSQLDPLTQLSDLSYTTTTEIKANKLEVKRQRMRNINLKRQEKHKVPELIYLKSNNLKHINKKILVASKEFLKPKQQPQKVKPKQSFKDNTISKLKDFSQSDLYPKVTKSLSYFVMFGIVLGFLSIVAFVFIGLFIPQWFVGSIETVKVPLNATELSEYYANQSASVSKPVNVNPTPVPTVPTPSQPQPNVINVVIPPSYITPQPVTPSPPEPQPVAPPPSTPTVSNTSTVSSNHDTSNIPSGLKWQTSYQCYWDLRDKGFGKELEVEYACNSQGTGLWVQACECCKVMGRCS
jgi:hypothetical protein